MTELNEMNPTDANLNAEPNLENNVETNSTENVIDSHESKNENDVEISIESVVDVVLETPNEIEVNETPIVEDKNEVAVVEISETITESSAEFEATETPVTESKIELEASIDLATDALETAIDEHEFDADLAAIEHTELHEQNDYATKTKDELLAIALLAASEKPHSEAFQMFKNIKPYFDAALHEEQNIALHKYIEEGGEKDDFEFKSGIVAKDTFNKASKDLRDKIATAKAIAEAERLKNLKAKESVLEKIKALNSSEETKDSLAKLKELQTEWKNIKNVPKEHVERLWESYRVLNEIFYDKLSINNEIAQMDRERNLDAKINLCKKVSELSEEKSIKSALIAVKKYQEDWRNIGPVPKEANEDIWSRFKAEVDKVYVAIKAETEKNEAVRQENLALKLALIEKSKELASYSTTRIKDWMAKTKDANDLMEEWKKIGYVPMAEREKIWDEFKDIRNTFFNNKNNWFKTFNAIRNENFKKKTELFKQVENIAAAPIDWGKQTAQIKSLQEQWKEIGPVPDKFNDEIWKKFRGACDLFFVKKAERFAEQNAEQGTNLIAKKELIIQLETLATQEGENTNVLNDLKAIQDAWSKVGFVPNKDKDLVGKSYNDLLDKIYGKHRELRKNMRSADDRAHFESMANNPDGAQRLQREERVLQERIKGLKSDIDTWDNNLGFFKNSNTKNDMIIQFHDKISAAQKLIKELEDKLKSVRTLKNNIGKTEEAK
jgi:hypothetical protein